MHTWSVGDHLTHRFNPELGAGRVAAVEGRVIVVQFATATLRFAASSDALIPEVEGADRKELTLIERLVAGEIDDTDEDPKGRVARLEVHIPGEGGRGIVAIYKDGPQFDVRAIDSEGRHRPEWAEAFRRRPLRAVRMRPADAAEYDWLWSRVWPRSSEIGPSTQSQRLGRVQDRTRLRRHFNSGLV